MLDQNTDRMWYVIGALVVGAGIILLANKAMPEVFANITKTFKDTTDEVTSEVDLIGSKDALHNGMVNKTYYRKGYVSISNGQLIENSYRYSTHYIPVETGATRVSITQHGDSDLSYSNLRMNAYDESQQFISNTFYEDFGLDEMKTYYLPEGTAYIVFGWMDMTLDYEIVFSE